MIKIHRIQAGNGNCYVLEKNESAVLVDTGKAEYRDKIAQEIRQYPIRLIVLTHTHFDHCENASYFAEMFQVPIAVQEADLELIQDNIKQELSAKTLAGKVVLKASMKAFQHVSMDFNPTVFLKDGDSLKQYGVDADIVGLPGHTKGSVGVNCHSSGVIVGDALMNMFYPTISMLYWNRELVIQSAKKISQLGDVMIYFGHGKPKKNRKWIGAKL